MNIRGKAELALCLFQSLFPIGSCVNFVTLFDQVIADELQNISFIIDQKNPPKVYPFTSQYEMYMKLKEDEQARGFYEWCQGEDWETVVDLDTEALVNYEKKKVRIFRAPIETIPVPLLITVSREDEMLANDMAEECRRLHEANPDISYQIFDTGGHPLIAARAEETAKVIKEFLEKQSY